jgi:hypothetical protein
MAQDLTSEHLGPALASSSRSPALNRLIHLASILPLLKITSRRHQEAGKAAVKPTVS